MKWILCFVAVWTFGQLLSPVQATDIHPCNWTMHANQKIFGGVNQVSIKDLGECKTKCEADPNCKSFDWDVKSFCWFLKATEPVYGTENVDHYHCDQAGTTAAPRPTTTTKPPTAAPFKPTCQSVNLFKVSKFEASITTNYGLRLYDLYANSAGITWNFETPKLFFDLPSNVAGSSGITLQEIEYAGSTNLAYVTVKLVNEQSGGFNVFGGVNVYRRFSTHWRWFGRVKRVRVRRPGKRHHREWQRRVWGRWRPVRRARFSFNFNFKVSFLRANQKVLIYFVPEDFTLPIEVQGLRLWYCPGRVSGTCAKRDLFANGIKTVVPGWRGIGTDWSGQMFRPFIEVDFSVLSFRSAAISKISFARISGVDNIQVQMWNNGVPVNLFDESGDKSDFFEFDEDDKTISFNGGSFGDRLRIDFTPEEIGKDEITGGISFTQISIFIFPSKC